MMSISLRPRLVMVLMIPSRSIPLKVKLADWSASRTPFTRVTAGHPWRSNRSENKAPAPNCLLVSCTLLASALESTCLAANLSILAEVYL